MKYFICVWTLPVPVSVMVEWVSDVCIGLLPLSAQVLIDLLLHDVVYCNIQERQCNDVPLLYA